MMELAKKIIRPLFPESVINFFKEKEEKKRLKNWGKDKIGPAPHSVKQAAIKNYQEKYKLGVLVETGTYLGDMVQAQKNNFKKIYSIELAEQLFFKAKHKFEKDKNVTILLGDSGEVLNRIIPEINENAIFWLDGHYSGGITAQGSKNCPVLEELNAILDDEKYGHIILIDDARCFNGQNDYPTIEDITKLVKTKNYQLQVEDDIIRLEKDGNINEPQG